MAEGLVVLRADGEVLFCNPAAEGLWNLSVARVQGMDIADVLDRMRDDFESPESVDELGRLIQAVSPTPETVGLALIRPRRRDLAATVFPIVTSPAERLTGLLMRDITEERELQRRRDTFVSVASHELRTPMTTVMGFTELLMSRRPSAKHRKVWLDHIYEDSKRVVGIIDDLLNVSRIQSGQMAANREPVAVGELLTSIAEELQPSTDLHQLAVTVPKDLPKAMADRDKLV